MPETTVESGQTVDGLVLNSGDYQHVEGTTNNIVVNAGAGQLVYHGTTNYTIVNGGGYQVATDGTVNHTIVNHGADLTLYDGATSNDVLLNGGNQILLAPTSVANGTVVSSGSSQTIYSGLASGTIIGDNASQYVTSSTVYHITPVIENTTVTGGGTLSIDLSNGPVSVIDTRFLAGGHITLSGFGHDGNTVASFNEADNTLSFHSDAQTFDMHLVGNYSGLSFDFTSSEGNTSITALCFCRGTGIRTPAGDVAVERLRVGDEVVVLGGTVRPVRWIGSTTTIVNDENRPVIVRAGAFADGSPYRDLRVTHLHSFLFGDVLIPIGDVMNEHSIVWDMAARAVEIFHLGFDKHEVVLAEGAPAETYRDDGNRIGFLAESGATHAARAMPTYAPVVRHGPIVERTRRHLAERAGHRALFSPQPSLAASW